MTVAATNPINQYVANGSLTVFSFTFRINSSADIRVYLNGALQTTGFVVAGVGVSEGGTVTFAIPPANNVVVRLQRVMTIQRSNDYIQGQSLNADTLDGDVDRAVMMIQDLDLRSFQDAPDGTWDGESKRIKNVVDPINAQDVVTKNWVETSLSSSVSIATSAASNAQIYSTSAAASATSASNSATAADTSATNAETAADNAITTAQGAATTATFYSGQAQTFATNAGQSAGEATTSATAAATSATNAATSEGHALTYQNNALSYRNTALTYRNDALSYRDAAATSATSASASLTDFNSRYKFQASAPSPVQADGGLWWDTTNHSLKVSDGTTYQAYSPSGGGVSYLSSLLDVNIPTPANNNVLTYNSATSKWIAQAPSGGSAASTTFTASGNIAATNVQSAIQELDTEKAGLALANTFTSAQSMSRVLVGSPTDVGQAAQIKGTLQVDNGEVWIFGNGVVTNPRILVGDNGSTQYGFLQWVSASDYFMVTTDWTGGVATKGGFVTVGADVTAAPDKPFKVTNSGGTGVFQVETTGSVSAGSWNGTTIATGKGGTGLTSTGTANQILGVNSAATGLEYKTITAGSNVTVTHAANSITIAATGGGGGMGYYGDASGFNFFDDFVGYNVTGAIGWQVTSSGTGASSYCDGSYTTTAYNCVGEIALSTGTTATGRSAVHGLINALNFGNGTYTFETRTFFPTLSTSTQEYKATIGLHDGNAAADPVDGVYFTYNRPTSVNWLICTANNSTYTTTDTGVPVSSTAFQKLKIVVNAAGTQVDYYINGTSVGSITTNIPTAAARQTGICMKIIKSVGTTASFYLVDYVGFNVALTTAR